MLAEAHDLAATIRPGPCAEWCTRESGHPYAKHEFANIDHDDDGNLQFTRQHSAEGPWNCD